MSIITKFHSKLLGLKLTLAILVPALAGCHSLSMRTPIFHEAQLLGEGREWRNYPVVADFNNDGIMDLIATHRRPLHENSLHVWLGSGDGNFLEAKQNWSTPGYSGIDVADINADGKVDLIAGSHFGRVQTYISSRDSGFTESVFSSSDGYVGARLIDLNSDGIIEAVLLGNERAGIEIYEPGSTSGKWTLKTKMLDNQIGRDMRIIDFDRDGLLDIIACMNKEGVVILLQGKNGEWLRGPDTKSFFSATGEFRNLEVADLNSDGLYDIILNGGFSGVLKLNGPDVYLAQRESNGEITWKPSLEGLKVLKKPSVGLAVADLNGDGALDIVAGGNVTGRLDEKAYGLFLFTGDGRGNWRLERGSGLPQEGLTRTHGVVAHDINRDNRPDLVVTHGAPEEGGGYLSIWLTKTS